MARYFNGKEVELLAPAGQFEIFKQLLPLPCDAFYFGGKKLNMRLHRKDFNFEDNELVEASKMAHDVGKKIYVVVNNLHDKDDMKQLPGYLTFLAEKVKPDALIIQEFTIIEEVKRQGLNLNLHSSVMMNVHNLEMVKRVKELGITRIVVPRETPLSYVKTLASTTDMEYEYFMHGDMCVAYSGMCLYSGFLFGASGSRGRCMKPCRWEYKIKEANWEKESFPLAVKDMRMYEYIPELIDAGVTSFKIEGRMRQFEYLKMLVESYGNAINRYIDDPLGYDRNKDIKTLYENRMRDTSSAYAFGNQGLSNINTRYEGTGKFYSTGKVFSVATEEQPITQAKVDKLKDYIKDFANKLNADKKLNIAVKVNDYKSAMAAITQGADKVFLSWDTFLPSAPFTKSQILDITSNKQNTKIYLSLPHMMFDIDFEETNQLLKSDLGLSGIVCTNLGAISKFKNFKNLELHGDYQLNVYNKESADFYLKEGLESFTISPEVDIVNLIDILIAKNEQAHLIVQGSPTMFYMEHDLYKNLDTDYNGKLTLVDGEGFEHPVFKDRNGRNNMLLYRDMCYLPILKELKEVGLANITIEAKHLNADEVKRLVSVYKGDDEFNLNELNLYTFGAINYVS